MKPMKDCFPETPAGFRLRVEETLMNLEEKDKKNMKVHSRLAMLVAAVMILSFAATAVVQGDALRRKMNATGGDYLDAMVQDVHVSDGDGDFSFTIDEILWQGENMYFSYTVSVPDDGKTYLYSPHQLKLGGEPLWSGHGLDTEFFVSMFAIGGEYGTQVTDVVRVNMRPEMPDISEALFEIECVFMQTERTIQKLDREAYDALFTEPDYEGLARQLMKNTDVLYYTDVSVDGDPAPVVQLHGYPRVRAALDAGNERITPWDIENLDIAQHAENLKLSIPIRESEADAAVRNDVERHLYSMDGYAIEITKLYIDSFNAEFEAVIRKDAGEIEVGEWTGSESYARYYTLCRADGSGIGVLNSSIGGGAPRQMGNERVYVVDGHFTGLFPVKELTEIYLAPDVFLANGEYAGPDMNRAIKLNPIYNPDLLDQTPESEEDFAETDDLSA